MDFLLSVTDRVSLSTIHNDGRIYTVLFNPLNPGSDWYVVSPNNFNTLSDNLVMRITNKINLVIWF